MEISNLNLKIFLFSHVLSANGAIHQLILNSGIPFLTLSLEPYFLEHNIPRFLILQNCK